MSLEEGFKPGVGFTWSSVSAAIGGIGIPEEGPIGSVRLEAMLFKDEASEVCGHHDELHRKMIAGCLSSIFVLT